MEAIKKIKNYIFHLRVKKQIKIAIKLQMTTGRKYLVLVMRGKPVAVSKQFLKDRLSQKYFKKGTTIQELEQKAVFITK